MPLDLCWTILKCLYTIQILSVQSAVVLLFLILKRCNPEGNIFTAQYHNYMYMESLHCHNICTKDMENGTSLVHFICDLGLKGHGRRDKPPTIRNLKICTLKTFAVFILKIEQFGFMIE